MLKRFGIDTQTLDVEKFRSDYNALYAKNRPCRKTISLPKRKPLPLTENWITSISILTEPSDSRLLTGKRKKPKFPLNST